MINASGKLSTIQKAKPSEITLQVNGYNYGGWQTVRVTLGMEQLAGCFELTVSERWSGQDKMWKILPGNECRLFIGNTPIITGYVDEICPEYDHGSHSVRISGRDRTGALVDCSAIHKSGEWKDASLDRIAADLCRPFGVDVIINGPLAMAPFKKFGIQECETVFEALDRAARMRCILLMSDGQGNLLLTRAGSVHVPVALVKGQNIEKASGQFSHKDRFSRYIIKGQNPGSDTSTPEHNAQTQAKTSDPEIKLYRPLIIFAEPGTATNYKDRAIWERNIRAGQGSRASYTVTGWQHSSGLWLPNRLVTVDDDYFHTPAGMIITRVTYLLDDTGSRTELEICHREAFEMIDLPEIKDKKRKENSPW